MCLVLLCFSFSSFDWCSACQSGYGCWDHAYSQGPPDRDVSPPCERPSFWNWCCRVYFDQTWNNNILTEFRVMKALKLKINYSPCPFTPNTEFWVKCLSFSVYLFAQLYKWFEWLERDDKSIMFIYYCFFL